MARLFLVLAVVAMLIAGCGGAAMSDATHRYLALGDSFTIGTGVGADRTFPAELARRWQARGLSVALTNPAANGFTTDDLIARELPLAREVRPTRVTVLIGANDIVRGSTPERYRAQLRLIYDGLRAAGVPAAATYALPQPDWSRSPGAAAFGTPESILARIQAFNAIAREEVERAGGRYVNLFPLMQRQAQAAMLASDRLHPSAEALAEWADALDEVLHPS